MIYVGAAPNHTVVPLVRHMLEHIASDVFCVGSNYVWTWETNRVHARDRRPAPAAAFSPSACWSSARPRSTISSGRSSIAGRPSVFNTLVGESSYVFMRALHAASARAGLVIPMLSCSLCEPELKLIGSAASVGCITSSAYFESIERPENRAFVARWKARHGAGQPSLRRWPIDLCLRHAAGARHPPRRLDRCRRRAARRRQSPLRFAARPGLGRSGQQSLLPDAAPGALRCRDAQFEIFWEADAPERPDPYLSNLDLAAIGAKPTKGRWRSQTRPTICVS